MKRSQQPSFPTRKYSIRTVSLILILLMNLAANSQKPLVNDSLVCIPKTTAQNILKFKDSADAVKKAYNAISLNYNRLKQLSSNKDTLLSIKDRQINAAKKVIANDNPELAMWTNKSKEQNKSIKRQKFYKLLAIVAGSLVGAYAIIK